MSFLFSLICVVLFVGYAAAKRESIHDTTGILMVDSVTFPKIIPNPKNNVLVLVLQKHEVGKTSTTDEIQDQYFEFSEMLVENSVPNLLLTQVVVNGAQNSMLASRIGMKDKFTTPGLFLYKAGVAEPIPYPASGAMNNEALAAFVTKHTQLSFASPGVLAELAPSLAHFFSASAEGKAEVVASVVQLQADMSEANQQAAGRYIKCMNKVIEVGDSYIAQEIERLGGLLASPGVAATKIVDLRSRLNVLKLFQKASASAASLL